MLLLDKEDAEDEDGPLLMKDELDVEAEVDEEAIFVVDFIAPGVNVRNDGVEADEVIDGSFWQFVMSCLMLRWGEWDVVWDGSSTSGLLSVFCENLIFKIIKNS